MGAHGMGAHPCWWGWHQVARGVNKRFPAPCPSSLPSVVANLVAGLVGDDQFTEGLVSAFLLILFSEIGDKTFFIALLLALKARRLACRSGCIVSV